MMLRMDMWEVPGSSPRQKKKRKRKKKKNLAKKENFLSLTKAN